MLMMALCFRLGYAKKVGIILSMAFDEHNISDQSFNVDQTKQITRNEKKNWEDLQILSGKTYAGIDINNILTTRRPRK